MKCLKCNGEKEIRIAFPHNPDKCTIPCYQCDATGEVPEEMTQWMEDGEILKSKRIEKRMTLRNAVKNLDGDAVTFSRMEMGAVKPDMSIYDEL